MRSIKPIVFGVFVTLSVFCAVLYTSCSKDSCSGITCLHYSKCGGGSCNCLKGTGGANCEKEYRKLFSGSYTGTSLYSTPTYNINGTDSNNKLTFEAPDDTLYTKTNMVWYSSSPHPITLAIVINNSTDNGYNFTIVQATIDTLIYNGTGSVNGTTASVSMTKARLNNTSVKTLVMFNDFNKTP